MKKIVSLIYLVPITLGLSAQEYIKVKKDTTISQIKFFKNEIYQIQSTDSQAKTINFQFGKMTLSSNKGIWEEATPKNDYRDKAESFLKKKDSANYIINVSSVSTSDPIKLVLPDHNVITVTSQQSVSYPANKGGDYFRLIIPGSPTIIYEVNDFTVLPIEPEVPIEEKVKKSSLSKLIFPFIGLLVIGLLLFFLRKQIFRRTPKDPEKATYDGAEGLHAFANRYGINFKKLKKYNVEVFHDYDKLSEKQKNKFDAQRREFIIGYVKSGGSSNKPTEWEKLTSAKQEEKLQETSTSDSRNPLNDLSVIEAIRRVESNLSSKIDSLSSNKAATEKVNQLIQEKESLAFQVKQLIDKADISTNERKEVAKELIHVKESKSSLEANLSKYLDKIIFVDFLENYARTTFDYFTILRSIEEKSFEVYNKLSQQSEKEAFILSLLMVKHQSGIPSGVGRWEEIVSEIKNKKTISNSEVIRALSQPPTPEEKFNAFQRMMLAEVLEKYTGSTLLLAEELSHFSKFTGVNTSIIQDIELSFTPLVREIVNKSKSIGLEVKHVPLFENYQPYASYIKVVSDKCSLVYRNIKADKDAIAEIISYGFGNEQTKVILG